MQFANQLDKATLQMLASLEQRLAQVCPSFNELSAEDQRAIFLRAVESTPMSEIYEIEMTDAACIARREAIENEKRNELVHRAKLAGASHDDSFERAAKEAAKQLQKSLR